MDEKELLKAIMEDEHIEIPSDIILDMYIQDAKNAIKKHSILSEEEYNNANLESLTAKLAKFRYVNRKYLGIKNISEGNKSRSFEYEGIPKSIKEELPNPGIFSA